MKKAINSVADKAASKIALGVVRLQLLFGNSLNKWTRSYSVSTWKSLVILFVAAGVSFSAHTIIISFSRQTTSHSISVKHFYVNASADDSLHLLESIYLIQRKKYRHE